MAGLIVSSSQKPHPSTSLRAGFLAKNARNGAPRVFEGHVANARPGLPAEALLYLRKSSLLRCRVPHFSRSLREVGLFADTLPALSQRPSEFSARTNFFEGYVANARSGPPAAGWLRSRRIGCGAAFVIVQVARLEWLKLSRSGRRGCASGLEFFLR